MSSAMSGVVALMVVTVSILHFVSANGQEPSELGWECENAEVYRWSDRTCYTPQGE
ncbi:hypothetical protein IQ250_08100 [Pseudanabaenaceae cyanobacterium LEGE 13415]|nr:hypothetical protein [Pseudanabaenaceae cyanobacterium LEGE 13415]